MIYNRKYDFAKISLRETLVMLSNFSKLHMAGEIVVGSDLLSKIPCLCVVVAGISTAVTSKTISKGP